MSLGPPMLVIVETPRIVLIEDDAFMREALTLALRRAGFDVHGHEHGLGVEALVLTQQPDLVLVDLNLPFGPSGLMLTRRLRAMGDMPIVVISGSTALDDRLAAFEAGADDFVMKPLSIAELQARIHVLLRRFRHTSMRALHVGGIVVDESAHLAYRSGRQLALRPLEFRLLEVFCRHPSQVLSKVQLLEMVWGHEFSEINRVEVHISHLRRELERYGPRVIHTIRSVGYILQVDRLTPADPAVSPDLIDLTDTPQPQPIDLTDTLPPPTIDLTENLEQKRW